MSEENKEIQLLIELLESEEGIGDPRPGVGVRADGLPDLAWGTEIPAGDYTIGGDREASRGFDTKTVLIPIGTLPDHQCPIRLFCAGAGCG